METKELIALTLLLFALPVCAGVCVISFRARDAAFFLMTFATVVTDKLDVNFLSQAWYRGTTRGIEVSFVDLFALGVLVGSVVRPRNHQTRWYWPAGLGVLLLYFLYACCSVALSEPRLFGCFELSKMFRGILFLLAAASFIRTERELGLLILALSSALCLESALAVKQRWWDGVYRVTGSIEHANSLSMYLCLVAPVTLAAIAAPLPQSLRRFATIAVVGATLSIMLTVSRAGIPIFALVMVGTALLCFSWRVTLQKVAVLSLVAVALAGMVAKAWDTLKARYGEATLEAEYLDERTEGRGYYLRLARAIVSDNVMGVGLNNWSYWVSKKYGAWLGTPYADYDRLGPSPDPEDVPSEHYAAPAHNLAALTVGELGLPGLLLLGILWLRWLLMGARFLWKRRTVITCLGIGIFFGTLGIFMQSVTEWTYRQTHILFTFQIMMGALASLCWMERRAKRNLPRGRPLRQAQDGAPVKVAERTAHYEPVGA